MWRLVVLGVSLLVSQTLAYSSGADESACTNNLFPSGHQVSEQNSPSPYAITPSDTQYSANGQITVTLAGSQSFKGFLIVARPESDPTGAPVGSFSAANTADNAHVQTRCGGAGLTHTRDFKNLSPNRDNIELTWTAPGDLSAGNVVFYATFVETKTVFWANKRSVGIWDGQSAQPIATTTPSGPVVVTDPPALSQQITIDKCGSDKGCYRECEGNVCDFALTWKKGSGDLVEFELFASLTDSQSYVALGLAKTDKMRDVSVVACQADAQRVSEVKTYYAASQSGVVPATANVVSAAEASISTAGGSRIMRCRFTYDNNAAKANSNQWKDLNEPLFALIARGATGGGSITQHNAQPKVSPDALQLLDTNYQDVTGSRINALIKAHACIMVLAWVFCASIGLILARYYKPMWADNKACGQKVWFSYHRALMLCAMFLTIIAFIIILVDKRGNFELDSRGLPYKAHPIIGLIAIICSMLNPLIAAFRCHPGDSKRPIFNWVHWFFGTVAHVFAIVAIFLGMLFTSKVAVPSYIIYVMMVFCIFHVCVEFILEIHQCCMYDKNRDRQEEFQLTHKGENQAQEPKYAGRGFKCGMLALYLIIVTLLTIAIVVIIAIGGTVIKDLN